MPTTKITGERVRSKFFYIPAPHPVPGLHAGPVDVVLPSGAIMSGTFKTCGGDYAIAVVCRDLFATSKHWSVLPLKLGDLLDFNIKGGKIHLTAVRRGASAPPSKLPTSPSTAPMKTPILTPPATTPQPQALPSISSCGCNKSDKTEHSDDDLCKKLSCKFISVLRERKRARVDLQLENDWFNGAYNASIGQGNPAGAVLVISEDGKREIKQIVRDLLKKLKSERFCGQSRFDFLLRNAIHQIHAAVAAHSPITNFTFGRAQKVLNIILKYCYAWWLCYRTPSPALGDISWVDKWKPYMHVPVDNATIKNVKSKPECRSFRCGTWKWKMTEYEYLGIQDAVRKMAYAGNLDPICYEMKYIWIAV